MFDLSFSSNVKNELCKVHTEARHCNIAEITAIINTCGIITDAPLALKIQTENAAVAKKFFTLTKKTFNVKCEISIRKNIMQKNKRVYSVFVSDAPSAEKILNAGGLYDKSGGRVVKRINPVVISSSCCVKSYIRGAFISGGSLSDPEKTYHLEFVNSDEDLSGQLLRLINSFPLSAKQITRKGHYVIYLKEGENIVDLLNIMGAHNSLMSLENLRIVKEMRNAVNRKVNCETSNLTKTVNAAVRQIQDIKFINEKKGLSYLTEQLEEVARIRLMHQDVSLKELGEMLTPAISKSGVNHRLRKICEIAENLRGDCL